jgi:hypothetical protein
MVKSTSEFSNLVNQTFDKAQDYESNHELVSVRLTFDSEKLVCLKPYFKVDLKDVLINSVYVCHNNREVIIFNKAFSRAFSEQTGIPLFYIGCVIDGSSGEMFFSDEEELLIEALDSASKYSLAG